MESFDAFVDSLGVGTFAEIGDKTQLLSFLLAIHYRRPVQILLGITIGTFTAQALGVFVGEQAGELLSTQQFPWVLGLSFTAIAVWVLFPDRLDTAAKSVIPNSNALAASALGIFIAEIGDKTDIAAVALGARFDTFLPVVTGTTVGSLFADIPAVLGGFWAGNYWHPSWLRYVAAAIFVFQIALSFLPLKALAN